MDLKDKTVYELIERQIALEDWADLESSTWGDCVYDQTHKQLRESLFPDGGDPEDSWNDMWSIDYELGTRE